MRRQLHGDLFIREGLARKLDLQIGMDRRRRGCRFGQLGAHADERKLSAARHLKHVEIAIAVARIERFHGHSDQEIALPRVAHALGFCAI